jgi:hypothetical protein
MLAVLNQSPFTLHTIGERSNRITASDLSAEWGNGYPIHMETERHIMRGAYFLLPFVAGKFTDSGKLAGKPQAAHFV